MTTYTDITSDGSVDPRNDAETNSASLASHCPLHSTVHPDVAAAAQAAQRQSLIDQGWTPPRKPIDQPQVPTMAYLHPTSDDCVTVDPAAYQQPRELVLKSDVYDHITWLYSGIHEWRVVAMKQRDQHRIALTNSQAAAQRAIGHLRSILRQRLAATRMLESELEALEWLDSIGAS